MSSEDNYEEELQKQEAGKLKAMVEQLSEEDKESIHKRGQELADVQAKEEELSCLPTLKTSDIDRDIERTKLQTIDIGIVEVFIYLIYDI